MSYLLETLGRGLLANLRTAFDNQWSGSKDDDIAVLRQRFAASPTCFDLAMRLGVACLREARPSEAREAFEAARSLNHDAGQPLLGLACAADELGQLDGAVKHLQDAQTRDAGDPAIAFGVAFCYERQGQIEAAQAAYQRAIELCPELRNAHERLAAIAVRNGQWPAALEQYERLAEMEPGDLDVLFTLGTLYLRTQQPEEAIAQYQQALLIEPDNSEQQLATVECAMEGGSLGEAIEGLEKLIHKYPGVAPFHVQLADLYAKAGEDERALSEYRTALSTQPDFLEATVKLGTQHMRQGRYVDAALAFNRAVELNDRLIAAFAGLGVAQHDCGRKHESLATFDLAASLEPSTTLLFSEAMRLHLQSQQTGNQPGEFGTDDIVAPNDDTILQEAIRRHQQALANAPNHADLHYRYGLLLRQVGRHADAIQAFRNAVAINPNYAKVLVKLAICLKESGAIDEAIETFQQALRVDSKYVDVHYQLGLLFAQRNQFDLATEEFEQAAAGSGQNNSFRANLALALQNIGMVDKASAAWQSLCELTPETDDVLTRREHILRDANEN